MNDVNHLYSIYKDTLIESIVEKIFSFVADAMFICIYIIYITLHENEWILNMIISKINFLSSYCHILRHSF